MTDSFKESALKYHTHPVPGKLEIRPTKPLANKRDLSLAYSPGVAYACELIQENPTDVAAVTARGNLGRRHYLMVVPFWDWVILVL